MNPYLEPDLKNDFAHYVVRLSVLRAVRSFLPFLKGTVVDLGSGNMPYKSLVLSQPNIKKYIAVDWEQTTYYDQKPDLYWDGQVLPMENDSIDCLLMTEVWEHLNNPVNVLKEILRVLKPGGLLAGTTPFVWPLHEVPNDMQRVTPYGVSYLLTEAGFISQEISGAGGWNTALAQFLSGYVSFGMKSRLAQKIAMRLLYLPIKRLLKNEKLVTEFKHTGMVNLTVFKAVKPS